jgi:hypothetical protein
MGLARTAQPQKAPSGPAAKKKEDAKLTAQLRLTPEDLRSLDILTRCLGKKKHHQALHWLLSLDHPMLDTVRTTIREADRIRKEG